MSGNDERIIIEPNMESVSHKDRVIKGLKLIREGRTDDEIVNMFRLYLDFSELKTRYHIAKLRQFESRRLER